MRERRKRRDANHAQIIRELEQAGVSVKDCSQLSGFVDIACGYRGRTFLFEIKDPEKPPSKRALTPDEEDFHERWKGHLAIILTSEEAIRIMTQSH